LKRIVAFACSASLSNEAKVFTQCGSFAGHLLANAANSLMKASSATGENTTATIASMSICCASASEPSVRSDELQTSGSRPGGGPIRQAYRCKPLPLSPPGRAKSSAQHGQDTNTPTDRDCLNFTRLYQDLECIMPCDQSPSVGGAYAKRRGGHTTSREFTGDDGVDRARVHGAAAPFRARVGGLYARSHHRWATPYEPPLPCV
jgi:hypothetical protein